MMLSLIRFTNRNRPIISLILLMVITGSLATLYFYQPVSTVVYLISSLSILTSIIGLSGVLGTWIGSRIVKARQKEMDDLIQEWKQYNNTITNASNDKQAIELRLSEIGSRFDIITNYLKQLNIDKKLQHSMDSLALVNNSTCNFRLFSKTTPLTEATNHGTDKEHDITSDLKQLLASYPQTTNTHKNDIHYIKMQHKNYSEHHMKYITLANFFIDDLERRLLICEADTRNITIDLGLSPTK